MMRYPTPPGNGYRLAVVGGSSIGGLTTAYEEMERYRQGGRMRVGPLTVPRMGIDMVAGWVSILLGIKGPSLAINASCATGNYAIALGGSLIRSDEADAALIVCSEKAVTRLSVAGFCSMHALARMDPQDPRNSLRPFDAHRTGTLFGDGSSALLLESERSAGSRRARIYGEVAGTAMTDDAYHVAAPDPEGAAIRQAMRQAIECAGLAPSEIDWISAHGSGTRLNDVIETRAIKSALGEAAAKTPVSALKSMIGHQLGASASTAAVAALKAMEHGILPPTINLQDPDPECDLDYVPNAPRRKTVRTVLSNSFGFGGHNACVVFREYH